MCVHFPQWAPVPQEGLRGGACWRGRIRRELSLEIHSSLPNVLIPDPFLPRTNISQIRHALAQYFPDLFVHHEILSYDVRCLNHDEGCSWQGKMSEYEVCTSSHQSIPLSTLQCVCQIGHTSDACEYVIMYVALHLFIQDYVTKQRVHANLPCQFCGELQPGSEVWVVAMAEGSEGGGT